PIVRPIAGKRRNRARNLLQQRPTCEPSSTSLLVLIGLEWSISRWSTLCCTDQQPGSGVAPGRNRPQRQRRGDRQRRVARLTATRGAGLGLPRRNRCFRESDGQAPALAQGNIIGGPIRHSVPLLRDVMTAILV